MNQDKIGKLIKKIRKENNLTQADFAKDLGVTYQAVSKWENGKNIPDISILKKISNKYNIVFNFYKEKGKWVMKNPTKADIQKISGTFGSDDSI